MFIEIVKGMDPSPSAGWMFRVAPISPRLGRGPKDKRGSIDIGLLTEATPTSSYGFIFIRGGELEKLMGHLYENTRLGGHGYFALGSNRGVFDPFEKPPIDSGYESIGVATDLMSGYSSDCLQAAIGGSKPGKRTGNRRTMFSLRAGGIS